MMYEGEEVNTIDLLYEMPTNESDGVKVIVPVKWSDRNIFKNKINEQLAYFESVYFDVNVAGNVMENNFSILRSENFQISEISTDLNLHICLDNVYYPLDFNKLGIERINLPFGMRFSLTDGLFPTPNRESIRYTQEAKAIILDKIKIVANYFANKYNETIHDTKDIHAVFKYYSHKDKQLIFNNNTYSIGELLNYTSIPITLPKLIGVDLLDLYKLYKTKSCLTNEYSVKYTLSYGRMKESKHSREVSLIYDKGQAFVFNDRIGSVKKEYLKTILGHSTYYYFIKRVTSYTLYSKLPLIQSDDCYYSILNLVNHPKSEWRQRIKEFQYVQSLIVGNYIDLDAIDIPKSWLDARKVKAVTVGGNVGRAPKLQGEIIGKEASRLERYVDGKTCKFVPTTYKLEKLITQPQLMIYASHAENDKLDKLYYLSHVQKLKLVTFSDREITALSKATIHNLMSITTFMKGENKPFKRLVTAYLISMLNRTYRNTFNKTNRIKEISEELGAKLEALTNYYNKNFRNVNDNEIYEAMLEIAKENNLYDMTIYSTYVEVKRVLDKLEFIEPIAQNLNNYSRNDDTDKLINAFRDLFKYHKYRIDSKHYNLKLNDEVSLENEELTEETVDELINND